MWSYRLSRGAYADLDSIATFIRKDNPDRAESFIAELTGLIERIAENPFLYPSRDDLRLGLRSAVHDKYLIFYKIEKKEILIARVLHGARDLGEIL